PPPPLSGSLTPTISTSPRKLPTTPSIPNNSSKKFQNFFEGMQPAACIIGSKGDPIPHWRAEKCFSRCACPRKKRHSNLFSRQRAGKLCRGLWPMQASPNFLCGRWLFDSLHLPQRETSVADFFIAFSSENPYNVGKGGIPVGTSDVRPGERDSGGDL